MKAHAILTLAMLASYVLADTVGQAAEQILLPGHHVATQEDVMEGDASGAQMAKSLWWLATLPEISDHKIVSTSTTPYLSDNLGCSSKLNGPLVPGSSSSPPNDSGLYAS
ncbi:hypothetical protein B0H12DRAFT_1079022 [Mycena haematopus]|nr:hypothetical protein B0H12DRAFT_1079022 [Mycena haematopus]